MAYEDDKGMTISYAILIVIFPCFLTYFYPTGHDVPEEV